MPPSFEATKEIFGDQPHLAFVKLGATNATPASAWKMCLNNPRRAYAPINLFLRKIMEKKKLIFRMQL